MKPKILFLLGIALAGAASVFFTSPVRQSQAYHHFADCRQFLGFSNFWNVVSNLPFLLVGISGVCFVLRRRPSAIPPVVVDAASLVFFAGIFCTGFGSAWYHLHPDNYSLLWDRLPMTVAFMAFFSVVFREWVNEKAGTWLLFPLVLLGLFSVLYWQFTERQNHGDLRLYLLVQFLPMILIPLILLLFNKRMYPKLYIWLVVAAYVLAKGFEMTDELVFRLTGISGHTLKHLAAAASPAIYLVGLRQAQYLQDLRFRNQRHQLPHNG